MANDVQVKRYYWSASGGATSVAVTIDSVNTAKSFARPIASPTGGTNNGGTNYVIDVTAMTIITGATEVTVYLDGGTTVREGYFEVWEYTGPTGGSSEFKVLHHARVQFPSSTTSQAVTLSTTATTAANCVAIWSGYNATGFGSTEQARGDELTTRLEVTSTTNCQMTRFDGTAEIYVGVTVIEFTGSDWTVNKYNGSYPSSTTGVATLSMGFTVSSWATSMYFYTWEVTDGGTGQDDITLMLFPGSGTTSQIRAYNDVSRTTPPDFTLYVVEHADLSVEHNDSIDGTANDVTSGGFKPATDITAPTDWELSTAISFYVASNGIPSQNAANSWTAWLPISTNLDTEYGSSNQDEDNSLCFSIIDLDAIAGSASTTYPQSVAGSLTSSGSVKKSVDKSKAGTLGPAGTPKKQTYKSSSGSITPSATIKKQTRVEKSGGLGSLKSVLRSKGAYAFTLFDELDGTDYVDQSGNGVLFDVISDGVNGGGIDAGTGRNGQPCFRSIKSSANSSGAGSLVYIYNSDLDYLGTEDITIVMWLKVNSSAYDSNNQGDFHIFNKSSWNVDGFRFWGNVSTNLWRVADADIAGSFHYTTALSDFSIDPSTPRWQMVAMTYNDTTGVLKIYNDDKLIKEWSGVDLGPASTVTGSILSGWAGTSGTDDASWDVETDCWAFFYGELTAADISDIYNAGTGGDIGEFEKLPQKVVSGSVASSSTTKKSPSISKAGSIALAGSNAAKALLKKAGSITPTGAFGKTVTLHRSYSGSMSSSADLVKTTNLDFQGEGFMTSTGSLSKSMFTSKSGSLLPGGSVLKTPAKNFTGTLTPSGDSSQSAFKVLVLGGSLALAGATSTVSAFVRSLSGAISAAGDATSRLDRVLGLSGSIATSGSIQRLTAAYRASTLTSSGGFTPETTFRVEPAGQISPVGTLNAQKQAGTTPAGAIEPTGSLTVVVSTSMAGVVASSSEIVIESGTLRSYSGSMGSSGTLSFHVSHFLTRNLYGIDGRVWKSVTHIVDGEVTSGGSFSTLAVFHAAFNGSVPMVGDYLSKPKVILSGVSAAGGVQVKKGFEASSGELTLSGEVSPSALFGFSLAGAIEFVGELINNARKSLSGAISTITSSLGRNVFTNLGGTLAPSDAVLTRNTSTSMSGSVTPVAEDIAFGFYVTFSGAVSLSGSALRKAKKVFSGEVPLSSSLTKSSLKVLTGSLSSSGLFSRAVSYIRSFVGTVTSSGSSSPTLIQFVASASSQKYLVSIFSGEYEVEVTRNSFVVEVDEGKEVIAVIY